MPTTCSVPHCRSMYGQIDCLRFHNFPKNPKLSKKWILLIRRDKFCPSKNSKVCGNHFTEHDYITYGTGSHIKLKSSAVPSKNLPVRRFDRVVKSRPYRQRTILAITNVLGSENLETSEVLYTADAIPVGNEEEEVDLTSDTTEAEETGEYSETGLLKTVESIACQTEANMAITVCIKFDIITESNLKYVTGFTFLQFQCLFETLSRAKNVKLPQNYNNILSQKDQLIICLFKYKLNPHMKLLSLMYGFEPAIISQIFKTWTCEIYKLLRSINFWNLRYKYDSSYTVILDCTEIPTQHSNNPRINQQLFSNYKNRQTLKYLVGIDEKGAVIFVSNVFGGGISDNEVIVQSKILDELQHGDTVLSDRGFTCTELFERKGVALNVPPFKGPRLQLEEHEVLETRIVANRRIHVERVINLSKKNLILAEVFPAHLWNYANKIVYNTNMLCNFKNSVVK